MSGTFDISFEENKISPLFDIPANISSKDFSFLLESLKGIDKVYHWRRGECSGFTLLYTKVLLVV